MVFIATSASAKVVGYQNLDVVGEEVGGNSWLINTLPAVGKKLDANTLGDLKVVIPEGGLVSEYSVHVLTYNEAGQYDGDFVYLDADSNGALYDAETGWYTTESVEAWELIPCGDAKIEFGRGFNILSDCGAKITCAGEVASTDFSVTVNGEDVGGNTWTGNCSPVDLTLADFGITPPEGGLTSEYSIHVLTYDDAGQYAGDYVYLDADSNGALYDAETGWYTTESVEAWELVPCGTTPVKAGQMINILSDCGATLTIPSAL